MKTRILTNILALPLAAALVACGSDAGNTGGEDTSVVTAIPANLAPFGEGYPSPGNPCRQLGESAATSDYLDDSAVLVGCPTPAEARALGGTIVDTIDGITLVSVPTGNANAGMPEMQTPVGDGDALVPGTEYNATSIIPCGFGGAEPTRQCPAGIIRNWGEDGAHLIEVEKPDGLKRAIFLKGTEPFSADSSQADGSAGWDFETSRNGDEVTIKYGPETYVIFDAMVTGG